MMTAGQVMLGIAVFSALCVWNNTQLSWGAAVVNGAIGLMLVILGALL